MPMTFMPTMECLIGCQQLMEKENCDALFGDVEFASQRRKSQSLRRYHSERFRPERIAPAWMPAHPALFLKTHVYDRFGISEPITVLPAISNWWREFSMAAR